VGRLEEQARSISLAEPDITEHEIAVVTEVLRSRYLSLGPKLTEFEQKFAEYIGVKHAVAVSSGTAGLHLVIKSLNIGENDAVITSPFSFISSANCMLFERAIPIFVDIEPETFNIDAEKIEHYIRENCYRDETAGYLIDLQSGRRVKAILPVHVFGHPCAMDKIVQLADKYGLCVIEDACEAVGAEFRGQKTGTFGNAGVFAFYPNKQMTTGEGGMIVTGDDDIAMTCRSMRNQGRDNDDSWLAHQRLGYNYRISEINCALGIAQLSRIDEILLKRAAVAKRYEQCLSNQLIIPATQPDVIKSWFVYVVCLPDRFSSCLREEILIELKHLGIGCNNYFQPIHMQPFYRRTFGYQTGDYPVTESISERTLALPFYNNLNTRDIEYIAGCLKRILCKFEAQNLYEYKKYNVGSYQPA
jgi:perosamine synthetase